MERRMDKLNCFRRIAYSETCLVLEIHCTPFHRGSQPLDSLSLSLLVPGYTRKDFCYINPKRKC